MSDVMRPMSFGHLMNWVLEEYSKSGSIFGVFSPVKHSDGQALPIFEEKIEAPFGPAAGPNTQLAQNIIAAYAAGARFFELKTVQVMDGPELAACINKPCITAGDSTSPTIVGSRALGRVLQLRMVHGVVCARSVCRVCQSLGSLQAAGERIRIGRSGCLRV